MCPEFITAPVGIAFERRIYLAPSESHAVFDIHLHETSTHEIF